MSGLLADLYSAGDRMKRKLGGLLSDPMGTIALGSTRMAEDTNALTRLVSEAGYMPNTVNRADQSVLVSERQKALARALLADKGAEMGMAAATVWHGSPHKFDKFDSSKIGTGEGAQAYGHGLYLAESPDVARSYQKALSGRVKSANVGADVPLGDARGIAHEIATVHRGNVEEFIKSNRLHYALEESRASAIGNTNRAKVLREIADENEAIAKQFLGKPVTAAPEGGSLYKVDLPDEAIAKMLDWDKPLSQQAPEVRKAFSGYPDKMSAGDAYRAKSYGVDPVGFNESGQALFDGMAALRGRNPALASESLRRDGIPGIRYLDGGSRGAGAGSSNYVVFPGEENILTILERNGPLAR